MKFRHIYAAALCAAAISSCSLLDIPYDNALSSSNMWQDPSDLEQSVPGIYKRMRDYFSKAECNVFYLGEVRVGDSMWGASLESKVQDNFKIACRHSLLSASSTIDWSGLYSAIDQANAVIAHAADCHAPKDRENWALAQAYFARAYCYFQVARIWGYAPLNLVPIVSTDQPECYPEQATPGQILALVEKDLESCGALEASLGSEKYFGTADAYRILKADYALWMYSTMDGGASYLTMAEDALVAMNLSSSKLLSDYASVFDRLNKQNSEIIFSLACSPRETGGYQVYFCQPGDKIARTYQNNPVPISSTQWWSYPQSFVDFLKSQEALGDRRVATNLGYGPYSSAADKHEITWCNKLVGDRTKSPVVQDNDLIYYRYGYAVMLLAELNYYKKDYAAANAALNIIAKRAYGRDGYYTAADAKSVLDNIVHEYYCEFPAEGVIWWALIRTGRIWDVVPNIEDFPDRSFAKMRETNPNILLWPVARASMNKNYKLKQVEGWS